MNKELIDQLIESREKLTNVRDEAIQFDLVDFIDTQLAKVPAGEDNRVDLLLGRQCAVLPVREGYFINPAVTLLMPETVALVEQTRLIFEAAEPIEY